MQGGGDTEIIGAVKIKDGLFIGDEYAAQDLEFVVTNKVTHVINTSGKQIPNHWEPIGVTYLTLNWMETDYQVLFDSKDEILNELYNFLDNTLSKEESILVHSVKGQNRSCCVLAAYFMKKYRWTLYKTLEYLHSRKPNLEIRSNFFTQLVNLENKLAKLGYGAKTYNWNEIGDDNKNIDSEELLITNTFLNSKKLSVVDAATFHQTKNFKQKINWKDAACINGINYGMLVNENSNTNQKDKPYIKSILKGSNKIFSSKTGELTLSNNNNNTNNNALNIQNLNTPGGLTNPLSIKNLPKSPMSSLGNNANNLNSNINKDQSSLKRPSSGSLLKSNSVSALEKAESLAEKSSNVKGNIIHITVNNFITNNNELLLPNTTTATKATTNTTTTTNSITNGNIGANNEKLMASDIMDNNAKMSKHQSFKTGLTTSNSNKDLMNYLSPNKPISLNDSTKQLDKDQKRGYSPSMATFLTINSVADKPKTNTNTSFNGKTTPKLEDDSPNVLGGLNKIKGSSSVSNLNKEQAKLQSTLKGNGLNGVIFTTGFVTKQNNFFMENKSGIKPLNLSQQLEKETSISNPNAFNKQIAYPNENIGLSTDKSNAFLYKYMTNGGKGPIRVTNMDMNPKQSIKKEHEITDYASASAFIKNSLVKERQALNMTRPSTAPENTQNKEKRPYQKSPYSHTNLAVYGRSNKNLDYQYHHSNHPYQQYQYPQQLQQQQQQRQSSAQPSKDIIKQTDKDLKMRLRSFSPGNGTNSMPMFAMMPITAPPMAAGTGVGGASGINLPYRYLQDFAQKSKWKY